MCCGVHVLKHGRLFCYSRYGAAWPYSAVASWSSCGGGFLRRFLRIAESRFTQGSGCVNISRASCCSRTISSWWKVRFHSKNHEFCAKNHAFCAKNDEFRPDYYSVVHDLLYVDGKRRLDDICVQLSDRLPWLHGQFSMEESWFHIEESWFHIEESWFHNWTASVRPCPEHILACLPYRCRDDSREVRAY